MNTQQVIKVIASIDYLKNGMERQLPIVSGYCPAFSFQSAPAKIPGKIDLIDRTSLPPGNTGLAEVTFVKGLLDDGYFTVGEGFVISDEPYFIGKGEITQVISI